MIEVLVWLLISVTNNNGNANLIERFKTAEECQRVSELIPVNSYMKNRCIQANILVPK